MAIPVYLWLEDDCGTPINGCVDVNGRDGSIEVLELMHSVEQPTDHLTGKATAKRLHSSYAFMKSIDSSSSYLYKALSSGQTLKKAVFKFYRINYSGQEEEYFRTTIENVKVTEIEPFMMNIKKPQWERHDHLEYVDLAYEKITWHYLDGNIIHTDSWKGRAA
ncbi:type VI secretion system tube protein TssD [Erwinia sp. ErVv1]|uniref:type VI secretion system tube protein TssD n=1 Tax=Erwinia sp. ErVv1 TaxID=1603299 RepID=UPI000833166C|nr:type VI secretion system tube protein TssD [Erwinia sp. ErVv1]